MSNHEDLFTDNQNRLLSIAGWANNLAWVVLIIYMLLAALTIPLDKADYQRMQIIAGGFTGGSDYWEMARSDLFFYVLGVGSGILARVLTGIIYFVVLKGISLGLYMVIETDINYHEREKKEGVR